MDCKEYEEFEEYKEYKMYEEYKEYKMCECKEYKEHKYCWNIFLSPFWWENVLYIKDFLIWRH